MASVDSQSESIWQGYVAAIASLLIGLLLLVSLFAMAIGLIGGLHETYRKAVLAAGFKDANDVSDYLQELKTANAQSAASDQPNDTQVDLKVALETYRSTSGSEKKRLLSQLSDLKLERVKLDALNLDKRDPTKPLSPSELAKINFDAINWGQLTKEEIDFLKPLIAQSAFNTWKTNQEMAKNSTPAKNAPPKTTTPKIIPPAAVTESTGDIPKQLRLLFLEESTHITPMQNLQLVTWAKEWRRRGSNIEVSSVWTGTGDPLMGRSIYLRMASLRENLVQAGIEASAITVNLERQTAGDDPKDIRVLIREFSK
ncbi:MAG: hypothetical protein ORN28_08700 [Rhodoferax sp.]|nr:hypothetical protein [Rhodoferax sp.]